MIMPTLVRVRKNSSSSSNANKGPGILPFIGPMSMIWRGSTCPSSAEVEEAVAARSFPVSDANPVVRAVYWKGYSATPSGLMPDVVDTQVSVHVPAYPGGVEVPPSAVALVITTCCPTGMPNGASVQQVTEF